MKARSPSSSTRTKLSRNRPTASASKEWTCQAVLRELRSLGELRNVEGMAHFGIRAKKVYGVSKPRMDILAQKIGRNRPLAQQLWDSGVHDARILAGMIDDASQVTAAQMDQ